jgi:hypothetical protein
MPSARPKVFAVLLLGVTLAEPVWGQDPFARPRATDRASGTSVSPQKGRTAPAKKKASRPRPGVEGIRPDDRGDDRPDDRDAPLWPPAPPDESEKAVA